MWGTVQDLLQNAATLPDEEDTKVVRLAAAMLIFFIVCIVLLLVYLVCRYHIADQVSFQLTNMKHSQLSA